MAKVWVKWLGPVVDLPAENRTLQFGDQLEMEEAEAKDRQAAGQVEVVNPPAEVERSTSRKNKEA